MPEFSPFDYGAVLRTAEGIKGARRSSRFDDLQEMALTENMQAGREDRKYVQGERQYQQQQRTTSEEQAKLDWGINAIDQILASPNPTVAARALAPEAIRNGMLPANVNLDQEVDLAGLKQMQERMKVARGSPIARPVPLSAEGKVAADRAAGFDIPQETPEAEKPPGSYIEYQLGLADPGYAAFLQQKSTSGQAQKPPPGYQFGSDGATLQAIPGGPAAEKREETRRTAETAVQASESGLDRLRQAALELLYAKPAQEMALPAEQRRVRPEIAQMTGIVQSRIPTMRQSTANIEAQLKTLKSQIAFTVLQAMRDASKTGGALGNVSNYEIGALENNLAALETSQDEKSFADNLLKIVNFADSTKARLRGAYSEMFDGTEADAGDGWTVEEVQ